MPGIVLNRAEDRPYGPGNPDYIYDQWRDAMNEAEREFEEWWTGQMKGYDVMPSLGTKAAAKAAYLAAYARATERAEAQLAKAREALRAAKTMMDRGQQPEKLDSALTWRENDELARRLIDEALGGQDDQAR